ncbi:hypothetical protein TNCV_1624921, partial [Trichonephila clavipes]
IVTNVFRYLTSIAAYSLSVRAAEQLENSPVITPHMNITYRQTNGLGIVSNDIGGHMGGRMLI